MTTTTISGSLPSGSTAPAPRITCYLPAEGAANEGTAVIIFPGGGYGHLAEHEGRGYAEYLAQAGIAGCVVEYRLGTDGHRHPAMLEDALAAIATVRRQAEALRIDPTRVGVMGSSAGGHLAAHAVTAWPQYEADISLRPAFGILCYPVILSGGPHGHLGSYANLCGADATDDQRRAVSPERLVTPDTPPCFLWHTGEDLGVPLENSIAFAQALRAVAVPFELHLYARGGHGLGLACGFDWAAECRRWLGQTLG
jgi:acetyl esterase/lipase